MMTRTVGVEEELLLVTTGGRTTAAIGAGVVSAADEAAPIDHEFKQEQAELGSSPTTSLEELRTELAELRRDLAQGACENGGLAVAIATSPLLTRPHTTPDQRYEQMIREFGLVARQQLTCGQHVHVGIESREEGVAVLDRIRCWLPVIRAISANSPFWQGSDTGYASYRTMLWNQWPTAGPTDIFGGVEEYDQQVADLIATGAALDDGMIYFDARLSARYPTVEIRVADVCTDLDDAVLVAALCRALVDTAAVDWLNEIEAQPMTVGILRAAGWRAARWGLSGDLLDGRSGKVVDAWRAVETLVDYLSPALIASGDDERVSATLSRLRASGTGADIQRAAAQATGGLPAMITDAARRTLSA